ncbi:glucodextranase DOMON-like domain-containing protein [Halapricum sp. CBA1109]|uniref:glucodextranase DOMON-like domain-containing protein n=1 Tax=Halapricum sp. CBA1109 TaxID=2668068 RepID=UPI0018D2127F|nr:glucodextranase DOMON-like domain-containing protein [Halapricum sp. CBA1109]
MQRREYLTRAAGLGALAVCGTTGAAAASTVAPGTNVLTIEDGTGDNNGDGNLRLPENSNFYETAWDVDVFTLSQDDSRVYFQLEMAGEIQSAFGLDVDYFHEFHQFYIRDPDAGDDVPSSSQGFEGLNANFTDPYHYVLLANGEGYSAIQNPNGEEITTDVTVDVQGDTFVIDAPRSAIGGDITDTEVAILECPYDGTETEAGFLRDITENGDEYDFTGGSSGSPRVIDMVEGEGQDQTEILDDSGFGTVEIPYIDVDTESSNGGGDDGGGDDGGGGEGPTLPGQANPARDPDGDGKYEDVNGDGQTDLFDALDYYNNGDSDAVQNNVDAFDFDGDGDAGDLFDALELWNRIS